MRRVLPLAAASAVLLAGARARAVDPFEIQVYDGRANAPGDPGLELHVNHVFSGVTTATPPELPRDGRTHFTLEPAIGVLPGWELGAYFQTALRADGTFDFAGAKLRSKLVTTPSFHARVRLGLNVELAYLPERYDAGRWGSEIRPIAAWEDARFLVAVNPNFDIAWAGAEARDGPSFDPAAMAKVKLADVVAIGVEYYAALGPIASPAALRDQEHYVYEAVDLLAVPQLELNVGIGEGLTAASNALVAKIIVGYVWERPAANAGASMARPTDRPAGRVGGKSLLCYRGR